MLEMTGLWHAAKLWNPPLVSSPGHSHNQPIFSSCWFGWYWGVSILNSTCMCINKNTDSSSSVLSVLWVSLMRPEENYEWKQATEWFSFIFVLNIWFNCLVLRLQQFLNIHLKHSAQRLQFVSCMWVIFRMLLFLCILAFSPHKNSVPLKNSFQACVDRLCAVISSD